jgi:UDP-GlcNAc3NAcA epimerase
MKKIATVIGARPQFIKAGPVSKAILAKAGLKEIVIHTGQHYDREMSDIFFKELEMPKPHYNLEAGSGSHAVQTAEIMKRLEPILIAEEPDLLLTYGDTNSTIAGALAAAKLHIPIAHVEAGLRSFNMKMPEEINRIVVDRLSTILFAPTSTAVNNLRSEGILHGVKNVGDVMYDATLTYTEKALTGSTILAREKLTPRQYVLVTVHRAENTDLKKRLENILRALREVSEDHAVVFPIHPRAKKMIRNFALGRYLSKIKAVKPLGYLDMLCLEKNALAILTDSGGVQKEAYFQKVPCITLRGETEWVETIKAGWNMLADVTKRNAIAAALKETLGKIGIEKKGIDEYGDGRASLKIVRHISQLLCRGRE